jgi:hypothetical protein
VTFGEVGAAAGLPVMPPSAAAKYPTAAGLVMFDAEGWVRAGVGREGFFQAIVWLRIQEQRKRAP